MRFIFFAVVIVLAGCNSGGSGGAPCDIIGAMESCLCFGSGEMGTRTCGPDMRFGICEGCPETDAGGDGGVPDAEPLFMGVCYRCIEDDPYAIVCGEEVMQSSGQRACLVGDSVRPCSSLEACCTAQRRATEENGCGDICPENFTGPSCTDCVRRRTGPDCTECALPFGGEDCMGCADERFTGEECTECSNPRVTGANCDECQEQFAGEDCGECSLRFAGPECTECSESFTGEGCRECADPARTGDNCDECRFGGIEVESRLDGTTRSESEYDTEGRLIRKTMADGARDEFEYPAERTSTQRTFNSEGTPVRVRTLARDERNNIILEEWDEGADETINYRYEALYGPLTRTVFYSLNSQLLELTRLRGPDVVNNEFCDDSFCQESVTSELDDNGRVAERSYTFPTAPDDNYIEILTYDAEGRIASVVGNRGTPQSVATFTYENGGYLRRVVRDEDGDGEADRIIEFLYDEDLYTRLDLSRLILYRADEDADGNWNYVSEYQYDAEGRQVRNSITRCSSNSDGTCRPRGTDVTTRTYDGSGRLVEELEYEADADGVTPDEPTGGFRRALSCRPE